MIQHHSLHFISAKLSISNNLTKQQGYQFTQNKEFKGGIRSLYDPCVNAMGGGHIDPVTYGGELLYLRILRNHSAQSAHIIITA